MVALQDKPSWEDEDLTLFRDSLRKFLAAELVPNDSKWRKQKFVDRAFWRKAGDMGFLTPSMPEDYGGSGGTYAHEAIITEELTYALSTSFGHGVHGPIVAPYILHYGTEEQKRRWLPKMATGEMVGAIAMTEPGGGSDLQAVRTHARIEGDHYVINGSKTFITNGWVADLIIVALKTDVTQGARGMSLVVVETEGQKGFRRGRNLDKIGLHGSDTAELFFDDMRVPVSNRLGGEGNGFIQMMQQLPQERLGIAVGAQAAMEKAVDLTADYARDRKMFGKSLMDMQNTRFKLAECLATTRVTRAFVDQCIEKHLRGELTAVDASMAKFWCSDQQCKVIDECLQLHGGYGFMEEYPIARMYVDARVQRIYGGANEVMKELVARSMT